jgi:hypothetical protein
MLEVAAQIALILIPLALLARGVVRIAHFLIGMVCYFLIWFLFPRTWRAMHDQEIQVTRD